MGSLPPTPDIVDSEHEEEDEEYEQSVLSARYAFTQGVINQMEKLNETNKQLVMDEIKLKKGLQFKFLYDLLCFFYETDSSFNGQILQVQHYRESVAAVQSTTSMTSLYSPTLKILKRLVTLYANTQQTTSTTETIISSPYTMTTSTSSTSAHLAMDPVAAHGSPKVRCSGRLLTNIGDVVRAKTSVNPTGNISCYISDREEGVLNR